MSVPMLDKGYQVQLDSPFAKEIGFISENFQGYGWVVGKEYFVSFIMSLHEGQGHLRAMFDALLVRGYTIKVPTPFERMRLICERYGFVHEVEHDAEFGPVELMVKRP